MIVAVVCRDEAEKEIAVRRHGRDNCKVFGPSGEVRAERIRGGELGACGDCNVGQGGYLVVAVR